MRRFGEMEDELFRLLMKEDGGASSTTLFVLGAPRTGSTVLYQALCSRFSLPYISNLTNDNFPKTPIIGLAIQKALPVDIPLNSRYGKTQGALQPSEGSAIIARWFGGGHPSALVSSTILQGMTAHFLTTLSAAEMLFERPLVIKNPWNCFRVRSLAETLPAARFIWIRRDIAAAAKSDLAARYKTKGSPTLWNSATPANVDELRRLPPAAQVVENQYEFNVAIGNGLRSHADGRWAQVRYEDFCRDTGRVLDELACSLGVASAAQRMPIALTRAGNWELPRADQVAIDSYISEHCHRLRS